MRTCIVYRPKAFRSLRLRNPAPLVAWLMTLQLDDPHCREIKKQGKQRSKRRAAAARGEDRRLVAIEIIGVEARAM